MNYIVKSSQMKKFNSIKGMYKNGDILIVTSGYKVWTYKYNNGIWDLEVLLKAV